MHTIIKEKPHRTPDMNSKIAPAQSENLINVWNTNSKESTYLQCNEWKEPSSGKPEIREYLKNLQKRISIQIVLSFPIVTPETRIQQDQTFTILRENDLQHGILYQTKLSIRYEDRIDIFRHATQFLNNYPCPPPTTYTHTRTRHTHFFGEDTGICVPNPEQKSRETNESATRVQCRRKAKEIPKMRWREVPRKEVC